MFIYLSLSIIIFNIFFPFSSYAQQDKEWEIIWSPTNNILKNLFFVNSTTGWAAGDSGTIIHTTNGGNSWEIQNSTVSTFITDIFFLDTSRGWAITIKDVFPFNTIILKTTDGGSNWNSEIFPDSNAYMRTIYFLDDLNGWIGGSYIAGTSDGGATWKRADVDSSMVSGLPVYKFRFFSRQFGFACGGYLDFAGVVWRTTNYGENWSALGISPDQIFDLFILDSLNAVSLSGDPEGVYQIANIRTSDAGLNWSYDTIPYFGISFAIDFRTESEGWSASGYKFLFTSDKGETWIQKPVPDSSIIYDLTFPGSSIGFAVGEHGKILKYTSTSGVSSQNVVPGKFKLLQNYPNPFNAVTHIEFVIPETGFTVLKVYDFLGNEVETLFKGELTADEYDFEFPSRKNKNLASGIYFYQLKSGDYNETKKMVLLK